MAAVVLPGSGCRNATALSTHPLTSSSHGSRRPSLEALFSEETCSKEAQCGLGQALACRVASDGSRRNTGVPFGEDGDANLQSKDVQRIGRRRF